MSVSYSIWAYGPVGDFFSSFLFLLGRAEPRMYLNKDETAVSRGSVDSSQSESQGRIKSQFDSLR